MKNLQKYLMILETIMLSIGISACSKQPDFDAKSYVQSSLDAYYHGEYKDYANLLELSLIHICTHMLEMVKDLWDVMFVMEQGKIIATFNKKEIADKDLSLIHI